MIKTIPNKKKCKKAKQLSEEALQKAEKREGKGYPLQYSGLENSMEESMGWQRVRHNSVTFTFTFIFDGVVVFPTFFNLSLNFAVRSS